jgi:uncharacterized protein DUF5676
MMIQPIAFANALALTTAVLAGFLLILRLVLPTLFTFVFNAQFFGADVASLLPGHPTTLRTLGELAIFVLGAWGFGWLGAILYNRLLRAQGRSRP